MSDDDYAEYQGERLKIQKVVVDDFEMLSERIHAQLQKSEEGEQETIRIVLDIPIEIATLAAWLDLRGQSYHENREPFSTQIDMPPEHAHRKRARRALHDALTNWFHEELHELCTHSHAWLYEKPKPKPAPKGGSRTDIDDDIPF